VAGVPANSPKITGRKSVSQGNRGFGAVGSTGSEPTARGGARFPDTRRALRRLIVAIPAQEIVKTTNQTLLRVTPTPRLRALRACSDDGLVVAAIPVAVGPCTEDEALQAIKTREMRLKQRAVAVAYP